MAGSAQLRRAYIATAVALLLLAFAASWVVRSLLVRRPERDGLAPFEYDIEKYRVVDPALVVYREETPIALPLREPRGISTDPSGRIYVAGDRSLLIIEQAGSQPATVELFADVMCVARAPDGILYVGLERTVEARDSDGRHLASWPRFDRHSRITSIAAGSAAVFVGDAGNRLVLKYDRTGKLLETIGRKDPGRDVPGLLLPSLNLEIALGVDNDLWVANCGRLSVEHYAVDGTFLGGWGTASMTIDGFCGCCNPTHLLADPGGAILTSEKGLPRVKVYRSNGEFVAVVAAPSQFDETTVGLDLAFGAGGSVLVLDPARRQVRTFVPTSPRE